MQIIRQLWCGGYVSFDGEHFEVRSAKIWDLPPAPPDIGIAVSEPQSTALAGELGDAMIAIEPDPDLGTSFDAAGGTGKPRIGQLAVSFDTDARAAVARAREQFRWFAGGWKVNSELPGPAAFDAASQFVRDDDIEEQIPCGADVDSVVEAVGRFADARPWWPRPWRRSTWVQGGHARACVDQGGSSSRWQGGAPPSLVSGSGSPVRPAGARGDLTLVHARTPRRDRFHGSGGAAITGLTIDL